MNINVRRQEYPSSSLSTLSSWTRSQQYPHHPQLPKSGESPPPPTMLLLVLT